MLGLEGSFANCPTRPAAQPGTGGVHDAGAGCAALRPSPERVAPRWSGPVKTPEWTGSRVRSQDRQAPRQTSAGCGGLRSSPGDRGHQHRAVGDPGWVIPVAMLEPGKVEAAPEPVL